MQTCTPSFQPGTAPQLSTSDLWSAIHQLSTGEGSVRARMKAFRNAFSFAVPTPGDIAAIHRFAGAGGLCEVAAGRGLWARLLQESGLAVDASDTAATKTGFSAYRSGYSDLLHRHAFFPVRKAKAADAAAATTARTLLLIWPPNETAVASASLKAFRGDQLVYVGEGFDPFNSDGYKAPSSCTADPAFFAWVDANWRLVGRRPGSGWCDIYDNVCFFRRRARPRIRPAISLRPETPAAVAKEYRAAVAGSGQAVALADLIGVVDLLGEFADPETVLEVVADFFAARNVAAESGFTGAGEPEFAPELTRLAGACSPDPAEQGRVLLELYGVIHAEIF